MKYDEHTYDNLDEDLKINSKDLANEWLEQPQRFSFYANAASYFKRKSIEAAEAVKLVEAELKMEAAENPAEVFGPNVRATNERVAVYARRHPKYQEAAKKAAAALYRSDMAENAVFAFHQRKAALENLVKLAGMEYFATPAESFQSREVVSERQRRVAAERILEQKGRRRS